MKIQVKQICMFILISIAMLVTGCGNTEEGKSVDGSSKGKSVESITLKMGHPAPSDSVINKAAIAFGKEIEEKTNGKVKIQIFEGSQLGGQREMTEQIKMGTLEMGIIATQNFTSYVKEYNVLDLPFLFKDNEQAYKALDGELGAALSKKFEDVGVKVLGYWEFGSSHVTNSKRPIITPNDMKGLKIRVQPSPLLIDTYKSLGAEPITMDAKEVYTGLQQGILDGVSTYYFVTIDQKEYEQAKHFSELSLTYGSIALIINKGVFDSLDPETQKIFIELAQQHTTIQRQMSQEQIKEGKKFILNYGSNIVEANKIDYDSFRKAVNPVYEKYGKEFQDMINLVK
jgi:tripartite ATP-independent transporter DctP family solute receptor